MILVPLLMMACSTGRGARSVASVQNCDDFNGLSAHDKSGQIEKRHLKSISDQLVDGVHLDALVAGLQAEDSGVTADFIKYFGIVEEDIDALKASLKFLSPSVGTLIGYKRLAPSFSRACDFFEQPQVKMVHAIGTLAKAHLILYPRLKRLDSTGKEDGGEIESPWTGILDPLATHEVPLWLRFSIANPIAHDLELKDGLRLSPEFIPGLGLKFLIDGQKSVDLLAMESLAGQAKDHNYFKYDFSPDFSAHAPPSFNTAPVGADRAAILARYGANPVNRRVMEKVGERFLQIIPIAYPAFNEDSVSRLSSVGPHPFVISIEKLAEVDAGGHAIDAAHRRRPWRLVFEPAVGTIGDAKRRAKITDSTTYVVGEGQTDFRYKLAFLRPGDRVFYVTAETRNGKRYRLGEIILDSTPLPSAFADKSFFIQHDLDLGRRPENESDLAAPAF